MVRLSPKGFDRDGPANTYQRWSKYAPDESLIMTRIRSNGLDARMTASVWKTSTFSPYPNQMASIGHFPMHGLTSMPRGNTLNMFAHHSGSYSPEKVMTHDPTEPRDPECPIRLIESVD